MSLTVKSSLQGSLDADILHDLSRGSELTRDQLSLLSDSSVVRDLESRQHMPITGNAQFFLYNFKWFNYTVYGATHHHLEFVFYLAAIEGRLDVIRDLATKHRDDIITEFLRWIDQEEDILLLIAIRGHIALLNYLFVLVNTSTDINHPILVHSCMVVAYAICASGDMDLFPHIKAYTHRAQLDHKTHPNFGSKAAIINGHLNIVKILDDMDDAVLLNPEDSDRHGLVLSGRGHNLIFAAQSGHIDIMNYTLARYVNLELNRRTKVRLLEAALQGGNPKVINCILTYTKLKFKLEYLPFVIRSEKVSILQRFERQFRDAFVSYVRKHGTMLMELTDNLDVVIFLVKHGLDVKSVILSSKCQTNCGIVHLAVTRLGKRKVIELLGDNVKPYVREYLDSIV